MRRFDETEGEIYLISLDTFMIMSVVGLFAWHGIFLLNPSLKVLGQRLKVAVSTFLYQYQITMIL